MKHIFASAVVVASFWASTALADDGQAAIDAQTAAQRWVELMDSAHFGVWWEAAAALFKNGIIKGRWEDAARSVRAPLGTAKKRTLKSVSFSNSLPGAPDGAYAVVQFETQFEHKAEALETIIPMKESDGVWRVSGYFIK